MYESPERVIASLEDALEIVGDVDVTVARELTKMHEELINGQVHDVLHSLRQRERIYGEITIVFGAPREQAVETDPDAIRTEFERLRAEGMRRNDAVKVVAEKFGLRKNDVYKLLL